MSKAPKRRYSDDDLLRLCALERRRSIGFGSPASGSAELSDARIKALKYYQGHMDDLPSLENRSRAVSSDVADAVETALPDLVEILAGGDDVASFVPQNEQDQDAAQEETDYVHKVVFEDNDGFLAAYTVIKDALLTRTGIFHWYWTDEEVERPVATVPADQVEAAMAVATQQGIELEASEADEAGMVTLSKTVKRGKVCVKSVAPEDFGVSPDTVNLAETTYCVVRDRPRVQDLIARGVDPEVARNLPPFVTTMDVTQRTRDEAGENAMQVAEQDDLRIVETRAHYLRLDLDDDGDLEIVRVVTDAEERTLIEWDEIDHIPFGAVTPYINPHRFYGESLFDKLQEVQRIKTALLRMMLDDGYFALNQRVEVNMMQANEFTLSDLVRNVPGAPIRSKGQALTPIQAGSLSFDVFGAMEYASVMGEQRTGIMRNAQGLNPDTLHDTAKGALALLGAAQRRVRLIARIMAETGFKDMFLGVHRLLRTSYSEDMEKPAAKLRSGWKQVDPTQWQPREGMTIQVGVGSAGKEHDLAMTTQGLQIVQEIVQMQGGSQGPLVTLDNMYQWLKKWTSAAGIKSTELFFSDPANAQPQPPKPDPEMAKAQAQLQLEQAKAQGQLQLAHAQAQSDAQLQASKIEAQGQADIVKAQRDHELSMAKLQAETDLKRYQIDQELQLKRESLAAELQMKRELGIMQAGVQREIGHAKVNASVQDVEPGGEPG